MKKIVCSILILAFLISLVGCDTNMTSLPYEMPEDFSFTLTFGFDGYYDSKTGVLKNGYNYDLDCECQTTLFFDDKELKEIYDIFLDGSIDKWPNELTVSDKLVVPSYDIQISFTAAGKTEDIKIYGASSVKLEQWSNSVILGKAYYKIVDDYIKSSDEYKSLPPNQNLYD